MPDEPMPSAEPRLLMTVGVVSDTHIPDRYEGFHPGLLPALRAAAPQLILHAGDVCSSWVLQQLAEIAPVTAVRGNRDVLSPLGRSLPLKVNLDLAGVKVGLTHGHGGFWRYWRDKWYYLSHGYSFERYQRLLPALLPDARVIIFGHTHYPENVWWNHTLLFNPGSAGLGPYKTDPVYGLLRIYEGGEVRAEHCRLSGAHLVGRQWVANSSGE